MLDRLSTSLRLTAALVAGLVVTGCAVSNDPLVGGGNAGGEAGTGGATGSECIPGQQVFCACADGSQSIQVCNDRGTGLDPCQCENTGTGGQGTGGQGGGAACGDGACVEAEDEDCHTCEADCGMCAPCTVAPSCDNAQIPPPNMMHVPALDNVMMPMSKAQILDRLTSRLQKATPGARLLVAAMRPPVVGEPPMVSALRVALDRNTTTRARIERSLRAAGLERFPREVDLSDWELIGKYGPTKVMGAYPGGTVECGSPLLRVRAATVTVHEEDDDFANDIVYCALTSEAATASEIRVTPQTPNLDQGDSFSYPIEAGVFWGQAQPETPGGNLLLTYDCFEADDNSSYQGLIDSIGNAAEQLGGVAGSYGWIFDAIGAVAPVLSDAIGLDGDDHLFNAQQVIGLDQQLDLTNGRFWSVRRSGTHLNSDWDWELRVEAWGCAEFGTL